MLLDPKFLDAIKGFEGYSPNSSWDYKQYSSGYGTKAQPGDENIPADQRQGVYSQRFNDEVGKASDTVDQFAPNLPPGVKAALTSLTYNAGPAWQQSGLGQAIRAGDYDKARDIFLQYNRAGGQVNPGLVNRRTAEAAWFDQGGPQAQPQQTASASPASAGNGLLGQRTPGPPLSLNPPQAPAQPQAPVFPLGGAQPQAPMQAQQPMPPVNAPPIFYPPAPQVDLSRLLAAFKPPVFYKGTSV